ncbi:MAG: PAQR family membrane homeostasis protein TrhA [Egibacteraceae bacterium]
MSEPVPVIRARMLARPDGIPIMRGWLHGFMTPLALVGVWVLWQSVSGASARVSVAVFGVSMVALYSTSALYHVPRRWSSRARVILSRCDGAMIQLFIAGTFTPIAFHALSGSWRVWSLVVAWAVALVGATIAASPIQPPRWLGTLGYVAVGWLLIVPFTKVINALPWEGSGLIALGGILYTAGAVVYGYRRPNPFPAWFGYHEVFHLFVVAGSTAHYLAIWRYVV